MLIGKHKLTTSSIVLRTIVLLEKITEDGKTTVSSTARLFLLCTKDSEQSRQVLARAQFMEIPAPVARLCNVA